MHCPKINDRVRLTRAVPTLWLQCGVVGVVKSVWHSSPPFYEVEFEGTSECAPVRALIKAEELYVIESAHDVAAVH